MAQIRLGLQKDLDISWYANKKFDWEQMDEIRLGLEANIDVSQYAKSEYPWEQMKEIKEKLLKERKN